MSMSTHRLALLFSLMAFALSACDGSDRRVEKQTPSSETAAPSSSDSEVALVPLAPGGKAPPQTASAEGARIEGDPEQIEAGKQLFMAMNCVGCHFHGGGGMGPPLMDTKWIYGSSIDNIAATIREGRPNGMPSFRGFLPDEQIWQIAAYVKTLSAGAPPPFATQ